MQSTILENVNDSENSYQKRLHVFGAPERLLRNCTKWVNENDEVVELDDETS